MKYLKIGPANIKIKISPRFPNLGVYLGKIFQKNTEGPDGIVSFNFSKNRKISIAKNKKSIKVSGPDLDNINEPVIKIAILQVLFRFANLVSFSKPSLLLHGSTAIWEGDKAILFGDNGKNLGKTVSALELALKTKKFVVDEFSFYDVETNSILGSNLLPIHLRAPILKYLNKKYKFNLELQNDSLLKPSELNLEVVTDNELSLIIYPEYKPSESSRIIKLSLKESGKKLEILAFSHMVKLISPKYDRVSWLNQENTNRTFNLYAECHKLNNLFTKDLLQQIQQKVSSYKIRYNKPSQIPILLKKIVDLEKKRLMDHKSASAVVYFNKNKTIQILLLRKKSGNWVLPKGHIDEGESPQNAALREAKEEGGLKKGKVIKFLLKDSYSWMPSYGFAKNQKTVIIFLVKGEKISPKALKHEGFEEAKLLPADQALEKTTFDSEKEAIKKAIALIKKLNEK